MIVDRDLTSQINFRRFLEERGYFVKTLGDAFNVLDLLIQEPADIVFLDSRTEGVREKRLFAQIKKECPQTHVIVVISDRGDDIIREAMEYGAYGCVHKPFDTEELLLMIHHLLPKQTKRYGLHK